jgi:hypothetical protein
MILTLILAFLLWFAGAYILKHDWTTESIGLKTIWFLTYVILLCLNLYYIYYKFINLGL